MRCNTLRRLLYNPSLADVLLSIPCVLSREASLTMGIANTCTAHNHTREALCTVRLYTAYIPGPVPANHSPALHRQLANHNLSLELSVWGCVVLLKHAVCECKVDRIGPHAKELLTLLSA